MQDRPRVYSQSGGYMLLFGYLDRAKRDVQKDIGVFVGQAMLSLITVEREPGDVYLMHTTSPKRSDLAVIGQATYTVGWNVFKELKASRIYTMSPKWGRHTHRGSVALC